MAFRGVAFVPAGGAPTVTSAVSRKTHGAAGPFDVSLPLTGTPGVEDRSGGATNDFTMIVAFTGNVTVTGNPQAQVTMGTGTIGSGGVSNGGMVTVAGNVVTVPLTNVADQQTINVTLNGVNSASDETTVNIVIPMSRLLGDTNGNGAVNASDVSQTAIPPAAHRLRPGRRRSARCGRGSVRPAASAAGSRPAVRGRGSAFRQLRAAPIAGR